MDFITGGLAACGACLISNPFDVLKTRMQLQGELRARGQHSVHYRNVLHAGYVVAKNEGIKGLQKGLSAAVMMHSVRNSVRLGSYQWLASRGLLSDSEGRTIFLNSFTAGAVCGAAGAFFGSPLFLIKTQLQSQAAKQIAVGTQHGHSGVIGAFRKIYGKHGVIGLWRGVNGTLVRAVAGSSAQLTSFALSKDALRTIEVLKEYPVVISLIASIISGLFQTVAIQPFDLVSTRLYNQSVDINGKGLLYDGVIDCFIKVSKAEGLVGLYKGMGANYMRLAPHGALCLVFWDILKDLQHKYLNL